MRRLIASLSVALLLAAIAVSTVIAAGLPPDPDGEYSVGQEVTWEFRSTDCSKSDEETDKKTDFIYFANVKNTARKGFDFDGKHIVGRTVDGILGYNRRSNIGYPYTLTMLHFSVAYNALGDVICGITELHHVEVSWVDPTPTPMPEQDTDTDMGDEAPACTYIHNHTNAIGFYATPCIPDKYVDTLMGNFQSPASTTHEPVKDHAHGDSDGLHGH